MIISYTVETYFHCIFYLLKMRFHFPSVSSLDYRYVQLGTQRLLNIESAFHQRYDVKSTLIKCYFSLLGASETVSLLLIFTVISIKNLDEKSYISAGQHVVFSASRGTTSTLIKIVETHGLF